MKKLQAAVSIVAAIGMLAAHAYAMAEPAGPETNFSWRIDSSHATRNAVDFFTSYFTTKSLREVDRTVSHFSEEKLNYIDVPLGWTFHGREAMRDVFAKYMPQWPQTGKSYPVRILGDENSAIVAFVNTPELFGSEIRSISAVDMRDGKVIRWVDYWDGRHFGKQRIDAMRVSQDNYPADFKDMSVKDMSSTYISDVSRRLVAALDSGNIEAVSDLFSSDAIYEDRTLNAVFVGPVAIARYLKRAIGTLPYGSGSLVAHVVGNNMGGGFEWQAAPAYRDTVHRGITALEFDGKGKIERFTTVWDSSLVPDRAFAKLLLLSAELQSTE